MPPQLMRDSQLRKGLVQLVTEQKTAAVLKTEEYRQAMDGFQRGYTNNICAQFGLFRPYLAGTLFSEANASYLRSLAPLVRMGKEFQSKSHEGTLLRERLTFETAFFFTPISKLERAFEVKAQMYSGLDNEHISAWAKAYSWAMETAGDLSTLIEQCALCLRRDPVGKYLARYWNRAIRETIGRGNYADFVDQQRKDFQRLMEAEFLLSSGDQRTTIGVEIALRNALATPHIEKYDIRSSYRKKHSSVEATSLRQSP